MPTYKLTYFPVKALAEPIRFLLSYLEENFEDYRFEREQWPNIKPNMPFGKVPVLEIDGKVVHQSTAISRYLGKQAKLVGKDDWEALQIDIAVDTLHDFRQVVANYWYEPDEALKSKKKEEALAGPVPFYLEKFDQLAKENNGYLANGALSWGDLYFVAVSDYLIRMLGSDYFEKYENLRRLRDNVVNIPSIKKWIETRPESEL
uniref:glutathione transferase n=1 Tax=Riptortus pedestris TaxID=329032 RepID=R4WDX0_RIPPE|nr:glutathionetransferase [Riptortus pedestris]